MSSRRLADAAAFEAMLAECVVVSPAGTLLGLGLFAAPGACLPRGTDVAHFGPLRFAPSSEMRAGHPFFGYSVRLTLDQAAVAGLPARPGGWDAFPGFDSPAAAVAAGALGASANQAPSAAAQNAKLVVVAAPGASELRIVVRLTRDVAVAAEAKRRVQFYVDYGPHYAHALLSEAPALRAAGLAAARRAEGATLSSLFFTCMVCGTLVKRSGPGGGVASRFVRLFECARRRQRCVGRLRNAKTPSR